MRLRDRIRAALWGALLLEAFGCGSAKVAPLEEIELDVPDASDEAPLSSQSMTEPAPLKSLDGTTQSGRRGDKPEPLCALNAPMPTGVPIKENAEALHARGQQYILSKDGASAVAVLLAAEKRAPSDPSILGDLATALLQCRLYDEAIARAEKAAALAPNNVDIIANLAQIYQIVGRLDDAIGRYRAALEINEEDHAALNNLAVLLVTKRRFKEAELAAREAVQLVPANSGYLVNLGYVLLRQERLVDAEMVLRRAIDIDPVNADAHNQMGVVLSAQRRTVQAKEHFKKALELKPDHPAAKENLKSIDQQTFMFE